LENLVGKIIELTGKYIVSFEVPPGIGKTYYAIKVALEEASKGRVVVFALPNHQALITAFAYAVKHYIELMKLRPKRKWPYLVYYEGLSRFCPYFRGGGNIVFRKMLDKLLKEKKIDQTMYDRVKDLEVYDVMKIYGSMFICKYLCPVYKQQVKFEKEKIFITPNVANQAFVSRLYTSEAEKSKVLTMLSQLSQLKQRGLVTEIEPRMDGQGNASGYCIRAILTKTLTKTGTQLVMKGALILTPIHALEFILSIVLQRVTVLQKRGFSIPRILVIIDEYDYYIYKSVDLPLFLLDQLRIEKELAQRIFVEERDKRINGDPSYDWETLVATLIVYEILSRLENEASEFLSKYQKEASEELLHSPANLFADCASKPLRIEDRVYPPFAPRIVLLTNFKRVLIDIYTILEEFNNEFVNRYGISLFDVDDVKSLGLRHFLKLWENILYLVYNKEQRRYMHPALYRDFAGIYRVGYIEYLKPISIARKVVDIAMSTDTLALFYKVVATARPIMKNGKKVSDSGGLTLYGVYDYKLFRIFRSDNYDIALLSATGVPWFSNIFSTRSGGEGSFVPFYRLRYSASGMISTVFRDIRFSSGNKKEFSYIVIESEHFSKIMVVVTLDLESLQSYASHIIIYPLRELVMMPDTTLKQYDYMQYLDALSKAVEPYVLVSINFMKSVLRNEIGGLGIPALLVLAQRKDVAAMYTYMLYTALSQQASVSRCRGITCKELDGNLTLEKVMNIEEGVSHFVVYVRTGQGEFRFYVTWLRSKMSRGIDLPDDVVSYGVMLVGTPYRPPEAFDILPRELVAHESRTRSTYIEYPMYVEGYDPQNIVLFVHNPIDVAEAINELIQAVGRALRRAWSISVANGRIMYRIAVLVPYFTLNKIFTYSPLWFQIAFSY